MHRKNLLGTVALGTLALLAGADWMNLLSEPRGAQAREAMALLSARDLVRPTLPATLKAQSEPLP
ncbi:MAG: hypothetical protein FJ296_09215 [Planctomycetes bacterium]|nr:hypothetical protein [Planctomycetota bacterium]